MKINKQIRKKRNMRNMGNGETWIETNKETWK